MCCGWIKTISFSHLLFNYQICFFKRKVTDLATLVLEEVWAKLSLTKTKQNKTPPKGWFLWQKRRFPVFKKNLYKDLKQACFREGSVVQSSANARVSGADAHESSGWCVGCVCMCVILLLETSFLVLSPPTAPNLLRLKGSKELAVLLVPV